MTTVEKIKVLRVDGMPVLRAEMNQCVAEGYQRLSGRNRVDLWVVASQLINDPYENQSVHLAAMDGDKFVGGVRVVLGTDPYELEFTQLMDVSAKLPKQPAAEFTRFTIVPDYRDEFTMVTRALYDGAVEVATGRIMYAIAPGYVKRILDEAEIGLIDLNAKMKSEASCPDVYKIYPLYWRRRKDGPKVYRFI